MDKDPVKLCPMSAAGQPNERLYQKHLQVGLAHEARITIILENIYFYANFILRFSKQKSQDKDLQDHFLDLKMT